MIALASRLPALRLPMPDSRHWLASLVLAVTFALYAFAGLSVAGLGGVEGSAAARVNYGSGSIPALRLPLPTPEPLAFQLVAPSDAVAINAAIPLSSDSNPAASAFASFARTDIDRMRSLDCLTAAVYYEAAIEPLDGQRAVAQVVLNRVRHPAYPNSVCGVVYQGSERATGCQFTFTCDGSLARMPSGALWQRAREIAQAALAGTVYKPVGYATHYHTNWVVPYWSSSLIKVANVGTHIFYRWTGGWGRPAAFRDRHSGAEPDVTYAKNKSTEAAALAEAAADGVVPGAEGEEASVISFQKAVMRRYEPLRKEADAAVKASVARADVPQSHRWAITGQTTGPAAAPLGKKVEVATPAAPGAATTTATPEPVTR